MFIVTISNWRRKIFILACLILLAVAFSIGVNYSSNNYTVMVFEEMFDNPISTNAQAVQVEGASMVDGEGQYEESPNNGNLEEEFAEKEVQKGFWQTVLEKFRRE